MKSQSIEIAYSRNGKEYIAYNTKTGIFTAGVCVESAVEKYRKAYYKLAPKKVS